MVHHLVLSFPMVQFLIEYGKTKGEGTQYHANVNEGGVNTDQNIKLGGHEILVLASYSVSSSTKVANIYIAENPLLIAQDKQPCVKYALLLPPFYLG